jgi:integrase
VRGSIAVEETLTEADGQLFFGPPKTKTSRRTVVLPRRVAEELERHLQAFVPLNPESLVFTGPKGAPLRRGGFRRLWWIPATRLAGLAGFKVHELRHTFVALWIDVGRSLKGVQTAAGHSSAAFTLDRYGHRYEANDEHVQDRLDALLGPRIAASPRPDASFEAAEDGRRKRSTRSSPTWPQRDLNPCYRLERAAS